MGLLGGFIATVIVVILVFLTPELTPVVIYPYAPPIISVHDPAHDLGTILTDSKAHDTFYIYNLGGKPLVLGSVVPSCGCTVATLSRTTLEPGGVAKLTVALDTSIKLGHVRKTIQVSSNDPKHPSLRLTLTALVKAQLKGHARIKVKDPLVLFKGQCATCHVAAGKGESGKSLFLADCAMCHGANGQGAVAMGLLARNYDDPVQQAQARAIIAGGSPNTPEMPPWAKARGGPLTEGEIDSLVNFLVFQHAQVKAGVLNPNQAEKESKLDE
jgi:mono/diheme cytochrome c family protein